MSLAVCMLQRGLPMPSFEYCLWTSRESLFKCSFCESCATMFFIGYYLYTISHYTTACQWLLGNPSSNSYLGALLKSRTSLLRKCNYIPTSMIISGTNCLNILHRRFWAVVLKMELLKFVFARDYIFRFIIAFYLFPHCCISVLVDSCSYTFSSLFLLR